MKKLSNILIILVLSSCAQIVSPTGGPKDDQAPKVKSIVPENETTNFNSQTIKIRFDEFIDIKDPEQIIISPIIKEKPIIESDGKSISIDLKRSKLERDKTYTINFGNAIADIHEGTRIDNFSYAFTTGQIIDTCKFRGVVISALTGKPEKAFTIGLYTSNKVEDSLYLNHYPIYLSKTNEKGNYEIKNLPNQSFALFGFNDQNKNLKFDPNEDFSLINTAKNPCETLNSINLKSNQAKLFPRNKITDTLQLNATTYALSIYDNQSIDIDPKNHYSRLQKFDNQLDTLYYYTRTRNDSGNTVFSFLETKEPREVSIKNKRKSKPQAIELDLPSSLNPKETLELKSKTPFHITSKDSILLKLDTLPISAKILRTDSFTIQIPLESKQGENYELELKDSALTDIWGVKLRKRKYRFSINQEKETGSIQFNWTNSANENYIIELISDTEKPERIILIYVENSKKELLSFMKPGVYQLRISKDLNKNKKWDSADWRLNREMEPITILPLKITVKSNWEIEQSINLDTIDW